ncbi:hypothetical protein [Mycolicibacterium komossense]|uniref:Uncharacterized protein n=1 Tax=Mycolicibacterium komossense TaxID=1779 RepID=A0ABT3CKT1_9MYCO|nr:hypothetical protein [Mycolicibacterium komossense]MCV7229923.1 hypothetical protein [Mycolicibacterium komossense]
MTVYEVLTVVVVVVLATAATAAIYLGLLNWAGGVFVVRCAACHHLTLSPENLPQPSCPHCRHPALTHPLYTANHIGQPRAVRVVGDALKY